jgi:fructose-bisphosphate aldolase/6-deoxy-5-ketofructose 1-phosphate synthase
MSLKKIIIPSDVPETMHALYTQNMQTLFTDNAPCIIFAFDQKLEHASIDFIGTAIDDEASDPTHALSIAASSPVNALATHLGLIARYAPEFPQLAYIAKLNGKTNLFNKELGDPLSRQLWSVDDVLQLKEQGVNIIGIGYTIYLGSEHESIMLQEAAQCINQAHENGLLAIIWAYPRGKSVVNERDPLVIAGAAGVAASLGADVVKINAPEAKDGKSISEWLTEIVKAAGTTKVICAGGPQKESAAFMQDVISYRHAGVAGIALGRNLFQRSYDEAVALARKLRTALYSELK